MAAATPAPVLVPVRNANLTVVRALSDISFVLGFASIGVSILVWVYSPGRDPAHGERLAIFIGLWAPTFFALSERLGRYGRAKMAEATTAVAPDRGHWGA